MQKVRDKYTDVVFTVKEINEITALMSEEESKRYLERFIAIREPNKLVAELLIQKFQDKLSLNIERASGQVICETCKCKYYKHPTYNGITVICDGKIYHL